MGCFVGIKKDNPDYNYGGNNDKFLTGYYKEHNKTRLKLIEI
jgi:hypothetical protein